MCIRDRDKREVCSYGQLQEGAGYVAQAVYGAGEGPARLHLLYVVEEHSSYLLGLAYLSSYDRVQVLYGIVAVLYDYPPGGKKALQLGLRCFYSRYVCPLVLEVAREVVGIRAGAVLMVEVLHRSIEESVQKLYQELLLLLLK